MVYTVTRYSVPVEVTHKYNSKWVLAFGSKRKIAGYSNASFDLVPSPQINRQTDKLLIQPTSQDSE